jgi:hypothetical protein
MAVGTAFGMAIRCLLPWIRWLLAGQSAVVKVRPSAMNGGTPLLGAGVYGLPNAVGSFRLW